MSIQTDLMGSIQHAVNLLQEKRPLDQAQQDEILALIADISNYISKVGYPLDEAIFAKAQNLVELLKENPLVADNKTYAELARKIKKYPIFKKHLDEIRVVTTNTFNDTLERGLTVELNDGTQVTGYNKLLLYYFPKIESLVEKGSPEAKVLNECKAYLAQIIGFVAKLTIHEQEYKDRGIALDNPIKEALLAQELIAENDFYKVLLEFNAKVIKFERMMAGKGISLNEKVFSAEPTAAYWLSQGTKPGQLITRIPLLMKADNAHDYLELLDKDNVYVQSFARAKQYTGKFADAANNYGRSQTFSKFMEENKDKIELLSKMTYGELQFLLTNPKGGSQIVVLPNGQLLHSLPANQVVGIDTLEALKTSNSDLVVFNDNLKLSATIRSFLPKRLGALDKLPEISILKINIAYQDFEKGKRSADNFIKLLNAQLKTIDEKLVEDNVVESLVKRFTAGEGSAEITHIKEQLEKTTDLKHTKEKQVLPVIKTLKVFVTDIADVYNKLTDLTLADLGVINDAFLKFRDGGITATQFTAKLAEKIDKEIIEQNKDKILAVLDSIKTKVEATSAKSISAKEIDSFEVVWGVVEVEFAEFMRKYATKPHAINAAAQLLQVAGLDSSPQELADTATQLDAKVSDRLVLHDLAKLATHIAIVRETETPQVKELLTTLAREGREDDRNAMSDSRARLVAIANIVNPIAFVKLYKLETKEHANKVKQLVTVINNRMAGVGDAANSINIADEIKKVFPTIAAEDLTAITTEVARQDTIRTIVESTDPKVNDTANAFAQIASADTNITIDETKAKTVIQDLRDLADNKIKLRNFNNKLIINLNFPSAKDAQQKLVEAYEVDIQRRLAQDKGFKSISTTSAMNDKLQQLTNTVRGLNVHFKQPLTTAFRAIKQAFSFGKRHEDKATFEGKFTGESVKNIHNAFAEVAEVKETVTLLYRCDKNHKYLNTREKAAPIFERRWLEDVQKLQGALILLEKNTLGEIKHIQHELQQEIAKLQKQQEDAIKHVNKYGSNPKKHKDRAKEAERIKSTQKSLEDLHRMNLDKPLENPGKIHQLIIKLDQLDTIPQMASASFKAELAEIRKELMQMRGEIQLHFNKHAEAVNPLMGRLSMKAETDVLAFIQEKLNKAAPAGHTLELEKADGQFNSSPSLKNH